MTATWLARWLLPYVETPPALDRYVGASQIGITLSSLVLGAYAQATVSVVARAGHGEPVRARACHGASSRGGRRPRASSPPCSSSSASSCRRRSRSSIRRRRPSPQCCRCGGRSRVFRPFLALLNGMATLDPAPASDRAWTSHRHLHSPEEIELLIAESRDGGLLEPEEQQRLHRALRLEPRDRARPHGAARAPDDAADRCVVGRRGPHGVGESVQPVAGLSRRRRIEIVGTLRVKDLRRALRHGRTASRSSD